MKERYPDRVALFGGIWPDHPDPIGEVDRLIDEEGVIGLKFYPYDIYDGVGTAVRMDDPEAVYPILEHAQKRGLKSVAVHKAIAMAGCPVRPFGVHDLEDALIAFPGINFQIVHGGFAFLEETALRYPWPLARLNPSEESGRLVAKRSLWDVRSNRAGGVSALALLLRLLDLELCLGR